jgi:hypothetical protein
MLILHAYLCACVLHSQLPFSILPVSKGRRTAAVSKLGRSVIWSVSGSVLINGVDHRAEIWKTLYLFQPDGGNSQPTPRRPVLRCFGTPDQSHVSCLYQSLFPNQFCETTPYSLATTCMAVASFIVIFEFPQDAWTLQDQGCRERASARVVSVAAGSLPTRVQSLRLALMLTGVYISPNIWCAVGGNFSPPELPKKRSVA